MIGHNSGNVVTQWLDAKAKAEQAVALERELRETLTKQYFPAPVKGTNKVALDENRTLKLTHVLTYSLGNKDATLNGQPYPVNDQVINAGNLIIQELAEFGRELLNRLIKWKPELSGSEFEKLNRHDPNHAKVLSILEPIVTIKTGTPQLKLDEK